MSVSTAPFGSLTRDTLHQYVRCCLRPGGGTRPELLLLHDQRALAVVKDYRVASWPLRVFVGPWLIAREARIYRMLDGVPGVPRLIGTLDGHALVVEHIQGRSCADYADGELPAQFFERLREVVDAIHARGVVHCDIKNRSNIVVGQTGEPYIVDFASAFSREGSFTTVRRLIFERFRTDDLRAVVKAKLLVGQLWNERDAHFAFRRDPLERTVRTLRDAARWAFKLLAGGNRSRRE